MSPRQLLCERGKIRNQFVLYTFLHRRGRYLSRVGSLMGVHEAPDVAPRTSVLLTHNSLVSKPDDLRFGVTLSSAGEVHCVP